MRGQALDRDSVDSARGCEHCGCGRQWQWRWKGCVGAADITAGRTTAAATTAPINRGCGVNLIQYSRGTTCLVDCTTTLLADGGLSLGSWGRRAGKRQGERHAELAKVLDNHT